MEIYRLLYDQFANDKDENYEKKAFQEYIKQKKEVNQTNEPKVEPIANTNEPNVEPVDNTNTPNIEPVENVIEYNQTNEPNIEPVENLSNDPIGANASNPFSNFTIDLPFILRKYERPERLIDSLYDTNIDKNTPPVSPATLMDERRIVMLVEERSKYREYLQAFTMTRNLQFISFEYRDNSAELESQVRLAVSAPSVMFVSIHKGLGQKAISSLSRAVQNASDQVALIVCIEYPVGKTTLKHFRDEPLFQSYAWLKVSGKGAANVVEPPLNSIYDDPFSIDTLLRNAQAHPGLSILARAEAFVFHTSQAALQEFMDLPGEDTPRRPTRKAPAKAARPHPFGDYLRDFKEKDLSLDLYIQQLEDNSDKVYTFQLINRFCRELNRTIRDFAAEFPGLAPGRDQLEYFSPQEWTIYLLSLREAKDEQVRRDREFDQVTHFLQEPSVHLLLWNEQQRRKICFNLLQRPYNKNLFDDFCLAWFDERGVKCGSTENFGLLVSLLLLHPLIMPLWQNDIPADQAPKQVSVSGVFSADICGEDIEDKLDIRPDVEALAALIAYKDLSLPLAIGLFGHWGSGKSFFMSKLRKRIRDFQQDGEKDKAYCREIVHVEFNAWHYSDANLWANLMVNIFEHLQDHVEPKQKDAARKLLLQELESTREAMIAANKEVTDADAEIKKLNGDLKTLKETNERKAQELATVTPRDIYSTLSANEKQVVENRLGAIAKELQLGKAQLSVNQLQELIAECSKLRGRANYLVDRFVKSSPVQKALWIGLMLSPVAVIVALRFTQDLDWLKGMKGYISSFIAFAGGVVAWATPKLKKLNSKLDEIEDVRRRIDVLVDAKRQELKKNEAKLEQELEELARQRESAETKLHEAELRKLAAEKALADQNIQKQLSDFIKTRGSSDDYKKHLGLISIIRKDLGRLSELLKASRGEVQPQLEPKDDKKAAEKIRRQNETISKAQESLPKVERIVLYIDDLDRCQGDRVVHVLEALHLLLALDLFVVIVGVDARWVSKALADTNRVRAADEPENQKAREGAKGLPGQATAFDYLEKIFQIPLVLKPMNKKGTQNLLTSLFEIEPKAEEKMIAPPLLPKEEEPQRKSEPQPELKTETKIPEQEEKKEPQEKTSSHETEPAIQQQQEKIAQGSGAAAAKNSEAKRDEEEKPEPALSGNKLRISQDEMNFMHALSPALGGTPRTVKRFANLYRLLRVHDATPNYSYQSHEDFKAIMVLLAIVTGNGPIASLLLEQLEHTERTELATFARELRVDQDHPHRQHLLRITQQFQELEPVEIAKMKEHLPFVRRFSFRTLDV